jgi:predicted helicase
MSKAEIFYKDIGDYLSREEKLRIVSKDRSILNSALNMTRINPNEHGDWINKRNSKFDDLIPLESEIKFDSKTHSFFTCLSGSVLSSRDAWVFNFSRNELIKNIKTTIIHYNDQLELYISKKIKNPIFDSSKGSWSESWHNYLKRNIVIKEMESEYRISQYRPFIKCHTYFADNLNHRKYQMSKLFPNKDSQNSMICVTGKSLFSFSVLIANHITEFGFLNGRNGTTQCFPLYWYEKKERVQGSLFEKTEDEYIRHDAISDFILDQAKIRYGSKVTKEDIFYYVYGILHSSDYRKTFANDLKKMLPRLPLVEKVADFWAFSKAGRELADLHLNYEEQPAPEKILINGKPISKSPFLENQLTVNQMKFPSKGEKDTIIYNSYLTISNIPVKAYEYIVNGKSAIEWIIERYAITTHKESGIKNDPNDWAVEHENPQYVLDLLLSVITVSLNTIDIVANLPKNDWTA